VHYVRSRQFAFDRDQLFADDLDHLFAPDWSRLVRWRSSFRPEIFGALDTRHNADAEARDGLAELTGSRPYRGPPRRRFRHDVNHAIAVTKEEQIPVPSRGRRDLARDPAAILRRDGCRKLYDRCAAGIRFGSPPPCLGL